MTREDLKHDIETVQMIPSLYPAIKESDEQAIINVVEYASEQQRLEEQGLLLKLPCKVGDTVYYVDDLREFVDTCKVTRVECKTSRPNYMQIMIELTGKLWHLVDKEFVGKDVFLTEQEAQAALEKMKGDAQNG